MSILSAIIIIIGLGCMWLWAYKADIKARDKQYKKFLNDISELFYSTMNQKEEE